MKQKGDGVTKAQRHKGEGLGSLRVSAGVGSAYGGGGNLGVWREE